MLQPALPKVIRCLDIQADFEVSTELKGLMGFRVWAGE